MDTITLHSFFDAHCHFRTGSMLEEVLPHTVRYSSRGLAMPNTSPRAILMEHDVNWYRDVIRKVVDTLPNPHFFEPVMTIAIRDNTTIDIVKKAFGAGAKAGKVYPWGVTTNSEDGLRDFRSAQVFEVFKAMEDLGMLLLLHGELDKERVLVTKREKIFLPTLTMLAESFPNLKIVFEHASSKDAVDLIKTLDANVAATITAHHLCLTQNDVLGSGVQPHNACMPTPKDFTDRDALIAAATSGNPKFFLGSDTAPHAREKKECAKGACGVYSAPVLPEVLVGVFEECCRLDQLNDFCSRFGSEFYGFPAPTSTIQLIRQEWTVPEQIGSVVPFRAGETLQWLLV